jgi:hypothetical protein
MLVTIFDQSVFFENDGDDSIEVPRQEIYHLDGPARDVVVSTFFAEE